MFIFAACGFDEGESYESNSSNDIQNDDLEERVSLNEYTAVIDVDPNSKLITGVEKVIFKNNSKADIDEISFNMYINMFNSENSEKMIFSDIESSVYKYGKRYGYMNILNVTSQNEDLSFSFDDTILNIALKEPVKPDAVVEISFNFEAVVPEICHKIGANNNAMWLGSFLPVLSDKNNKNIHNGSSFGISGYSGFANYDVSVTVPKGYQVIGSGKNNVFEDTDTVTFRFNQKMIRDFAFAVGKDYLKKTITTEDNIDINFFYYSKDIDTDKVINYAKNSLMYLQNKVGSYPYEEFNIVETELYTKGCMEYPLLMFIDSEYAKDGNFEDDFCYNMAEQWFFCTIGIDKVSESWLCEGLSLYINDLMRFNEQDLKNQINKDIEVVKNAVSNFEQKTMNSPVEKFKTSLNYYYIEGLKAKIMFYSLNHKIGTVNFDRFIKQFYSQYMFKGACKTDMLNVIRDIYGADLSQFFEEWLEEENIPDISDN